MTKSHLVVLLACAGLPLAAQVYQDPAQPVNERVDDLVARMTLDEKASQLLSQSPAIGRLGVPAYDWWNECLHGVARAGRATVFPETIGIAATWDTGLVFRMATAISDEARAKYNEFIRRGKHGIYEGLTFWTPNINIFRDPRWGRGMETYGEDPYLTGRMAVQFIHGMEGNDPKYMKTVATAKHYAVHSGPESTRHVADIRVSDDDLRNTYLPQFAAAVKEGGVYSVMCAYNSVDGLPACANPMLLGQILRGEWNFPGYVVSDCGAVGDIYQGHQAAKTAEEGVALAVKAGTDLDCGLEYENVAAAVRAGLLPEKDVDTALRRLLTARFKLGMFDPPEMVPWTHVPYSVNESPEHQELAREVARESIVLLRNEGGLLPLDRRVKTIAVIGPNADSVEVMLGNYNGQPSYPVTPLEGIRQKVSPDTRVLYARGSDLAEGMPLLETVPASALYTSGGADRSHGLNAEYFNTAAFNGRAYFSTAFVSGAMRKAAVIPANPQPLFTRIDPQVDFNWWDGAPRADMNDDDFGVRWTGFLAPPVTGKYQLGATGLNAYEVYLNGKPLVARENVHERGYEYETVDLEAGKLYPIRVDFHEVHGDADVRLVWAPPHAGYAEEAVKIAQQADVVLMFLGLSPRLEGEEMPVHIEGFSGGDRVRLGFPQVQEALLQRVSALGKPVVLVLLNGSAVAVNWAHDHVPAIVELWYPGQAGGTALADVLFGDYNPGGRLPVTFYKSEDQLPPFDDYSMKGRTYRYFEGEPLYPFGYGLSYTTFAYSNLRAPDGVSANSPIQVSVDVENTGQRAGDEVVQLYIKHPGVVRELAGFERVTLQPGEKRTVAFGATRSAAGEIGLSIGELHHNCRILP
ncbi:MAG TPA: glycoside hydrolase family 3 C-terminal domain-containing protein [Bryobacteraceae bacterium]|nr:glycoside hydrolase family 3 C-terminal domain-containing protein [Bryobacteraceae bacterium]